MPYFFSDTEILRDEIAAVAARMIVEDGSDYGTAKRKAAKQILGNRKPNGHSMPDNAQIEKEVRIYNELFFGKSQPLRLLNLRKLALKLMEEFARFTPYLTGAVLNGTAGEHSDIHIQLFAESAKEVEIYLINKNIDFEISESPHFGNHSQRVEVLSFMWQNEGVHLALYENNDIRMPQRNATERRIDRANTDTIRNLIINDPGFIPS